MPRPLERIISGGQTGADQAGLCAAEHLGIPTGGTCPHGWRTDEGSTPELGTRFGLTEHWSRDYRPRTFLNVRNSDATIWFGNSFSPGRQATVKACRKLGKPFIENPPATTLRALIQEHGWRVLNIAGHRASKDPTIAERAFNLLTEALRGGGDDC